MLINNNNIVKLKNNTILIIKKKLIIGKNKKIYVNAVDNLQEFINLDIYKVKNINHIYNLNSNLNSNLLHLNLYYLKWQIINNEYIIYFNIFLLFN